MATKKVGAMIKEARTAAKLTQDKLGQAAGVAGADIGKCERGEIDLTNAQLKKIAVACGVTQSSLLNAPKNLSAAAAKKAAAAAKTAAEKKPAAKTAAAKKTAAKTATAKTAAAKKTAAKTTAAKKTEAKTTAAKKTAAKTAAAKKTEAKKPAVPAAANISMKVTSTEKKLVESYRGASSDLKKISLKVLKGEYGDTLTNILGVVGGTGSANAADQIGETLGNLLGGLIGK